MRTTLNLSDDIFLTTKYIARREHRSLGEVLSELARLGLGHLPQPVHETSQFQSELASLGLVPYNAANGNTNGKIVTNNHVNQLKDDEGLSSV